MVYQYGMTSSRAEWLRMALIVLMSLGVSMGGNGSLAKAEGSTATPEKQKLPQVIVRLGGQSILADVANTDRSRTEGLLGWTDITENRGMLLDFGVEREYAIHMQGMKFPIDAVWADSAGEIKLIYDSMRPNSGLVYPSMFPSAYCLEIKAGFCKKYGIKIGQRMSFGSGSN